MSAQGKIDRARWWAITEQPFYGSLSMSLGDVIDTSIPTAATNGKVIKWNPDFVDTLTDEEIRFILLHETLHCAHQHLWRLPIDERGNEAGDHEINLTLADIPEIKMPEGGLCDPQYRDMSCEEIYGRLGKDDPEDPEDESDGDADEDDDEESQPGGGPGQPDPNGQPQPGDGQGDGSGVADPCGSFTAPEVDPVAGESPEDLKDDWEGRVIQAEQASQAMGVGETPSDMQRMLDRMRHQSVDWKREMADFVKDAMSTRNDWSRAARRHAWQSVIYPRRMVDSFGTVIFVRDTSGSITDKVASEYSALITDGVAELGCRGIVLDADTEIKAEYEISDYEECPLTAKGGGGTKFQPVFDRAEELIEQGEQVAGIVYMTDMAAWDFDKISSEIPTLWLATADHRPPSFGRVVRIEVSA